MRRDGRQLTATGESRLLSKHLEVDERHLLLGLLKNSDCPKIAILINRGMTRIPCVAD